MEQCEKLNSLDTPLKEKYDVDKLTDTMKDLTITSDKQTIEKQDTKPKPKVQNRCNLDTCNKRLTITEMLVVCKCGNTYCTNHRHLKNHACTYDYKQDNNKKELVHARFNKLNKI